MMEVKVFSHQRFRDTCDPELLKDITARFIAYKRHGIRHETFGDDRPYFRPESIRDTDLRHIHIRDASSKNWDLRYIRLEDKTSDTALIYTRGYLNPGYYLLISFLKDAHRHYGGTEQYIRAMAEIARKFRDRY
ncbi:type II toxin-antitoxin system YafO family toxin [Massilia sp. W12]|uniref:type II toxin-antitoxin system YafO family toxin n=1 Tax=Massilia sp. W12 TaxID=3126507 RepID=UPI0030CBEF18